MKVLSCQRFPITAGKDKCQTDFCHPYRVHYDACAPPPAPHSKTTLITIHQQTQRRHTHNTNTAHENYQHRNLQAISPPRQFQTIESVSSSTNHIYVCVLKLEGARAFLPPDIHTYRHTIPVRGFAFNVFNDFAVFPSPTLNMASKGRHV